MNVKPCPFCDSGDVHYDDDHLSMYCVACGATGPEGDDERDAVDLWNETHHTQAVISVIESPHEDDELGAVRMVLRFGHVVLCQVGYCQVELAPTLRGALMLMGGMRQAKEAEGE